MVRLQLDGLNKGHTDFDEVKRAKNKNKKKRKNPDDPDFDSEEEYNSEVASDDGEDEEAGESELESVTSDLEGVKKASNLQARTNKPDEFLVKREATLLAIL